MSAALMLVVVVAGAYLAAHVAFEWLGRRFLIVSGAEYLLLGILLGPYVTNIFTPELVDSFAPITTLALGWMGALIGSRFVVREMVGVPGMTYRLAFIESFFTLAVVTIPLAYCIEKFFHLSLPNAIAPAAALGAIATASSGAGIDLVARRHAETEPLIRQLRTSTNINAFVAITAFGILLASTHSTRAVLGRPLTPTEWTVITIGIGIVGGMLFHLFLGAEENVDRLFISLAGAIILVSGAAAYLRLSPILAAMCFGFMLVNTAQQREEIIAALERVERPLYFVLLLFAGATWEPGYYRVVFVMAVIIVFLILRVVGKVGGARLGTAVNGMTPVLGTSWGFALLGQGGLAVAFALNYVNQDALRLADVVFLAAILSVLLTDIVSGRFAQSVIQPPSPENGVAPKAE